MTALHTLADRERVVPRTLRREFSRLQLSRMILSGTLAFVCAVMVVWMLIVWVMGSSKPTKLVLAATLGLPDASSLVAFPGRDAQGMDTQGWRTDPTVSLAYRDFAEAVDELNASAGPNPVVIYLCGLGVSAQDGGSSHARAFLLSDEGIETPIADVLERLVKRSKGPKLLLLDVGQVSSDRDLGIFGNAFLDRLKELIPKDPDLAVITSCAPGQSSWESEFEGRSIFGYYVTERLMNKRLGRCTARELYDYVRPRVTSWVYENRNKALQTPLFLGDADVNRLLPKSRAARSGPTRRAGTRSGAGRLDREVARAPQALRSEALSHLAARVDALRRGVAPGRAPGPFGIGREL